MSTSPAIIHQGPLRPKGQFRANQPFCISSSQPPPPMPSPLKIQIQKSVHKSPRRVLARAVGALVGWLASSTLHEFELNKLPHARPNDTRPAHRSHWASGRQHPPADRSLPPRVRVPLLYSIGISLSGWSRTTRQVSLTSTLLSCIQSFSRPFDRPIRRRASEGEGREKTVRRFTQAGIWDGVRVGDCCTDWR